MDRDWIGVGFRKCDEERPFNVRVERGSWENWVKSDGAV
jgi:hypothetical protein